MRRGLWGIENLSGIPGSVGAAPVQNIGAYGAEIKDTLEWVEVFDSESGEVRRIASADCGFEYRDSVFKSPENKKLIIIRVAFLLKRNGTPNLAYRDLKQIFNDQFSIFNEAEREQKIRELTPAEIRNAVLKIRSKKFPDIHTTGTAGSFFKNPIVSKEKFDALKHIYPALPGFPLSHSGHSGAFVDSDRVKIPLAWILDNLCGLKGFRKGNVALFERQPIVVVNLGGASAEEVRAFTEEVARIVKDATGITVEYEVQFFF